MVSPIAPQVATFVPVPSLHVVAPEHMLDPASQWQPLAMVLPIRLQFFAFVPVPWGQAFTAAPLAATQVPVLQVPVPDC